MLKKTPICPSNSVKIQKERKNSLISKNLFGLKFIKHYWYILRYRDGFYEIEISSIISQKRENGGIYT